MTKNFYTNVQSVGGKILYRGVRGGKKVKIKIDESRLRPYDVNRLICNNTKAQKLLKWKPKVTIEAGLKITFDWAKKNRVSFNAPFKRWYYKNSD